MVNRVLPLDVTWICQTHPTPAMVSGLASCGLRISLHVSPSQVRMVGCAHTLQVSLLSWTGEQVANDSVPLNLMQCLWHVFFGCVLFWIMTMGHKLVTVWAPFIQKHPCYYAGCCHIAGQSFFGSILVSVLLSKQIPTRREGHNGTHSPLLAAAVVSLTGVSCRSCCRHCTGATMRCCSRRATRRGACRCWRPWPAASPASPPTALACKPSRSTA